MYVIFLENYSCFNRLKHSLALQQHPHFVRDLELYGYLGIGIKPVEIER